MIYRDKSKEEIDAVLGGHLQAFEDKIGFKPSAADLLEWTKKRLARRIEEVRESTFGHLSPKSLELLIKSLENMVNPPPEPQKPKKKGKSGLVKDSEQSKAKGTASNQRYRD